MNKQSLKVKIILGSTRENRFSDKVGEWISQEIKKHENVVIEILDLRDYDLPFYDEAKANDEKVKKFQNKINEADAFIVVSPEYNHGPTAVLKNAFDWAYEDWNYKPIAFIGYGSVGAARSIDN